VITLKNSILQHVLIFY